MHKYNQPKKKKRRRRKKENHNVGCLGLILMLWANLKPVLCWRNDKVEGRIYFCLRPVTAINFSQPLCAKGKH